MIETVTEEVRRYMLAAMSSQEEMSALISVVIAAALVMAGSFVKTMIPLRWLAVGSNVGFIAYGALHPSYPMLLLHAALLPINIIRLVEMKRLTKRVESVRVEGAMSSVWLRPYMRSKKMRKGSILFRQGDIGDRLYLLADGEIEFTEIKRVIGPGQIFGEIAFFSPDHKRLLTARCATHCTVLSIDEETVKQLYFQNPAFGFKIIELVAERFSADVVRANARADAALAELDAMKRERAGGQLAARADASD